MQIEAWKIGDSRPAPRFNVIAKPNDWAKTVKQSASGSSFSDLKLEQQAFFERMCAHGEETAKYIKSWQTPRPQHWHTIRIGSSQAKLGVIINSREQQVGIELYINDNKELFHKLLDKKEPIEQKLGIELDWRELPERKASRILVTKDGDFLDSSESEELIQWLVATADKFAKIFPKYL